MCWVVFFVVGVVLCVSVVGYVPVGDLWLLCVDCCLCCVVYCVLCVGCCLLCVAWSVCGVLCCMFVVLRVLHGVCVLWLVFVVWCVLVDDVLSYDTRVISVVSLLCVC